MQEPILVLSPSREQAALAARTLRFREICCLPLPFETPASQAKELCAAGVILTCDSYEPDVLKGLDPAWLDGSLPVLALGGAAAAVCTLHGGAAEPAACERSAVTLQLDDERLFADISGGERMLHGFSTLTLPEGFCPIATATQQVIGFLCPDRAIYGMQYPIERNDPDAAQLLENFARGVCGANPSWDEDALIDSAVEAIRSSAPEGKVLCAVSGGVDSAVCAKLASMAVGDRLKCVFIDTGLFRTHEPQSVINTFRDAMGIEVSLVDAHDSFLRALSGVTGPQDKERIASQLMGQLLVKQFSTDPELCCVVFGTNFNDVFLNPPSPEESTASRSMGVCEPIRALFKDEVRRLASALNLPSSITGRQPFPSSGLALRVMSSVTEEKLHLLRQADAIFREEITAAGHDRRLWQFYATLIESPDAPESFAVCLRATQAAQGGALAARLPYDLLERAAERIRDEVGRVTRVVYDLTPSVHYGELE